MEAGFREVHEKDMQIMDERFKRDAERLSSLEEMQRQFLTLQGQLTEILKNQTKQLDGHETRLCGLEKKPEQWFERVAGGFLSALIAALVAYLTTRGV